MSSVKIELRQDQIDKIHAICDSFGNQEGELINVLHKCQATFGYLPATPVGDLDNSLVNWIERVGRCALQTVKRC